MISDSDGCFHYRVRIPFDHLRKFDVDYSIYCFIPNSPFMDDFNYLVSILREYDLVIIQRCYLLHIVEKIYQVCSFLGIPLAFEVDDSYQDLIPSNPAFFAICDDQNLFRVFNTHKENAKRDPENAKEYLARAEELLPQLIESRNRGLENYKKLLSIVDYVQVSTEELARCVYPHNKNVVVFENNVERVYPWRDYFNVRNCLNEVEKGKFKINPPNTLGLWTIPNHDILDNNQYLPIPRVGYSCTPSHLVEDFGTILPGLNKFAEIYKQNFFYVLLGDSDGAFFGQLDENARGKAFTIPATQYEKYMFNLRNIDIMLCPLFPTIFNMSKSDIKAVEAGAWGSVPLVPNFITYTRHWKNEENCLTYMNVDEFMDQLERLVKDYNLRQKLGKNALEYVDKNRRECLHSEKRYEFYKDLINGTKRLDFFEPNKVLANA